VVRRNMNRRHITGDHHGRMAGRATLLVRAMDEILGTPNLTAYLDACGRNGGRPPSGPDLERFLPWLAAPEDLRAWAQPPAPG
jgi:hypothetical protein